MRLAMRRTTALRLAGLALFLAAAGGYLVFGGEGPPMWWVLRGSHAERIELRWDMHRDVVTDPTEIAAFYSALRAGSDPLPYATKCLSEERPEDWSLTFVWPGQPPFTVQVGIDSCGSFYVPSVGSTYSSNRLHRMIHAHFGTNTMRAGYVRERPRE